MTGDTSALCLLCVCAHVRVREYMRSRVSLFVCMCSCLRFHFSVYACASLCVRVCIYACLFVFTCLFFVFLSIQHVDILTDFELKQNCV